LILLTTETEKKKSVPDLPKTILSFDDKEKLKKGKKLYKTISLLEKAIFDDWRENSSFSKAKKIYQSIIFKKCPS